MNTYLIELRGQVDIDELNAMSTQQMRLVREEPSATLLAICTDQSGLIGLLRHLHGLGFTFLSFILELPTVCTRRKNA